jgi:hypothetical protein
MNIEDLKAKLPDQFKPWAAEYGPAFLAMSAEEVKAWIELLIRGDVMKAYQDVLSKLPNAKLIEEWTALNVDWQSANEHNADRMGLQKAAAVAALKIMLAVAMAAVGL